MCMCVWMDFCVDICILFSDIAPFREQELQFAMNKNLRYKVHIWCSTPKQKVLYLSRMIAT
jgi:hypothetical protein